MDDLPEERVVELVDPVVATIGLVVEDFAVEAAVPPPLLADAPASCFMTPPVQSAGDNPLGPHTF